MEKSLGSKALAVRLPLADHDRLSARAGRRGLSQFVRSLLINAASDPTVPPPKSLDEERLQEMLSQIVGSGDPEVLSWLRQTFRLIAARKDALNPEEMRLVEEYRRSSYEKRARMMGFAAKDEQLEPELMPPRPPRKKK